MPNSIPQKIHEIIGSCLSFCLPGRSCSASRLRRLPEDIVIDILSRLPPRDALVSRRVCKEWRDLTSTQNFIILHLQLQRSIPLILVVLINPRGRFSQFLLQNWKESPGNRPFIHTIPCDPAYRTESSHAGLIVLQRGTSGDFMILNPTNNQCVNISVADNLSRSEILGVFFHPSLKEYCTLWRVIVSSPRDPFGKPKLIVYRLLNLGTNSELCWRHFRKNSNPCWKDVKNQWSHRSSYTSSVYVDDYLYWMVAPDPNQGETSYAIMEFSIKTEEITLMLCPIAELMRNDYDISVALLNVDGVLSLVLISPSQRLVNVTIWTLESRSNWLWKSSNYSFNGEVSEYGMLVPIVVSDGELVLDSGNTLLVCNLKLGTARALGNRYDRGFDYLPHVMSLVSLRNCKANICMDEKGEVEGFTQ